MISFISQKKATPLHKVLSSFIAFTFIFSLVIPPQARAQMMVPQTVLNLPPVGTMVTPSDAFNPVMIKGVTLNPADPFKFDFIVNKGDTSLNETELRKEATKLIKYFLASITVPEKEMWVNLSPYEKDRMVPEGLGQTELGRDMLAQDYLLKQLTSSLVYPEKQLGKKFWEKVYAKAQELYGTTDIPLNTFNKVWIVPENATVYVNENNAFVLNSHLKVMLEEDYVALQKSMGNKDFGVSELGSDNAKIVSGISSNVVREVVIPAIEKEVNTGKTFANLRQIFNSMILATWYKQNLKDALLNRVYSNQNKTIGVDVADKNIKNKIYNQYLEAFKTGVYNYIREDYDPASQEIVHRKYFSGGLMTPGHVKVKNFAMMTAEDFAMAGDLEGKNVLIQSIAVEATENNAKVIANAADSAMASKNDVFNAIVRPEMSSREIFQELIDESKLPGPALDLGNPNDNARVAWIWPQFEKMIKALEKDGKIINRNGLISKKTDAAMTVDLDNIQRLMLPEIKEVIGVVSPAKAQEFAENGNKAAILAFEHGKQSYWEGAANRIGWTAATIEKILKDPEGQKALLQVINDGKEIRENFDNVVFCGMGGSGLSVQLVKTTFPGDKNIYSLRTTDPTAIKDIINKVAYGADTQEKLKKLKIVVISKSGTTAETVSHLKYFDKIYKEFGVDPSINKNIIVYTDPGSPMDWTSEKGKKAAMEKNPELLKLMEELQPQVRTIQLDGGTDIGGRNTSPATNVFLLPLAILQQQNVVRDVLQRALKSSEVPVQKSQYFKLGAYLYEMAKNQGKDKVTFIVPDELKALPMWAEQLFEESLGKFYKGVTIFSGEDLTEDMLKSVEENDRVFVRFNLSGKYSVSDREKMQDVFINKIKAEGYPVFDINETDIQDIGAIQLGLQMAVTSIGYLWNITTLDQDDVEGYKSRTRDVMNALKPGQKVEIPEEWKKTAIKDGILTLHYQPIIDAGKKMQQLVKRFESNDREIIKAMPMQVAEFIDDGYMDKEQYIEEFKENILPEMKRNIITEEEIKGEVARLGTDMQNAPAVYAAIFNIANRKGGLGAADTFSYGRMSDEFKDLLQHVRSIYTEKFKIPTKLAEGPDINHSYIQNTTGGRDFRISTFIMPEETKQPVLVRNGQDTEFSYDENLLRAPVVGTIQSLIGVGRRTVLLTLEKAIDDLNDADLDSINKFFESVASYMPTMVTDTSILDWTVTNVVKGKEQIKTLEEVLNKIIKEYDIRGFDGAGDPDLFPQQMDDTLLRWIGRAMGTVKFRSSRHQQTVGLKEGDTFVIGGDNGPSTQKVKDALINGLLDVGVNVIDLGVTISGQVYSSISELGAQGGLYVTRSHVEVGTNGAKPNIGGITLYGEMLQGIKEQILRAQYRNPKQRGTLITEDVGKAKNIRARASQIYNDSLRKRYGNLAEMLKKSNIKPTVNLNGGSAVNKKAILQEILGENAKFLKDKGDTWSKNGLADPTRTDDTALSHPNANIINYSQEHPDEVILNFDLDTDRVSVLWGGKLYLGDEMFYPIIEYMLTMDELSDIYKSVPLLFDSRMKSEVRQMIEKFGGIAQIHPKGHSKVKATIDLQLRKLAQDQGLTKEQLLEKYPTLKIIQAEYSLHMFKTNLRGEAFDDALDFGLFWLDVFTKIKQKHSNGKADWNMDDYIQFLYSQGINPSEQLKEQRIPLTEEKEAKWKVMRRMTEKIKEYFGDRPDFEFVPNWETLPIGADYTLIDIEGVFHLFTPMGEIFWGWSNTSPKVAFGTQSAIKGKAQENNGKLALLATALMIHSRKEIEKEEGVELAKIHTRETDVLLKILGIDNFKTRAKAKGIDLSKISDSERAKLESEIYPAISEELETKVLKAYPTVEAVLKDLDVFSDKAQTAALADSQWNFIDEYSIEKANSLLREALSALFPLRDEKGLTGLFSEVNTAAFIREGISLISTDGNQVMFSTRKGKSFLIQRSGDGTFNGQPIDSDDLAGYQKEVRQRDAWGKRSATTTTTSFVSSLDQAKQQKVLESLETFAATSSANKKVIKGATGMENAERASESLIENFSFDQAKKTVADENTIVVFDANNNPKVIISEYQDAPKVQSNYQAIVVFYTSLGRSQRYLVEPVTKTSLDHYRNLASIGEEKGSDSAMVVFNNAIESFGLQQKIFFGDLFVKVRKEAPNTSKRALRDMLDLKVREKNLTKHYDEQKKEDFWLRGLGSDIDSSMAPGGINLDPAMLDLQIKRDANWVPLPMDQQDFENINVRGFIPVIIDITPAVNLPMLLGFDLDTHKDQRQANGSDSTGIDPVDLSKMIYLKDIEKS